MREKNPPYFAHCPVGKGVGQLGLFSRRGLEFGGFGQKEARAAFAETPPAKKKMEKLKPMLLDCSGRMHFSLFFFCFGGNQALEEFAELN